MIEPVPPSAIGGVAWPTVPPARMQPLLAVMFQLERSQWWSAQSLATAQLDQARRLVAHAKATSPGWRSRLADLDVHALDWSSWADLPLLTRNDLQQGGTSFDSEQLPAGHGTARRVVTSGSTGTPVGVQRTGWDALIWQALTLRETLWHARDPQTRLAILRHGDQAPLPGRRSRGWAPWAGLFGPGGEVVTLDIGTPIEDQLDWLLREDPSFLLTFPTNLGHLLDLAQHRGVRPASLRAVSTLSEPVRADLRERLRSVWGAALHDMYSAQECGYLAVQCPEHEHLHVMSEGVLLEVLDDRGRPCEPGQIGRVVVTSLHGYGTPLIRYAIGDHAEVGAPCACGRGLPVLTRILGRTRSSLVTARGTRHWPFLGVPALCAAVPDVARVQLVQAVPAEVDAKIVFRRPPDPATLAAVTAHFTAHLPGFRVRVVSVDALPPGPSGKFDDVISTVQTA